MSYTISCVIYDYPSPSSSFEFKSKLDYNDKNYNM